MAMPLSLVKQTSELQAGTGKYFDRAVISLCSSAQTIVLTALLMIWALHEAKHALSIYLPCNGLFDWVMLLV